MDIFIHTQPIPGAMHAPNKLPITVPGTDLSVVTNHTQAQTPATMKTNITTPRYFRGFTAIALALAALGLSQPVARAAIITSDDTVKLSAGGGQNNASVVAQWTTAKGSAPVDTANDLLKNHATMSMLSGGAGLGSTAYINDGLMLSGGKTSDSTDGVCLYTSSGHWTGSGPVDVVFTLDAPYNIGQIDGFTLWDLSRLGQKYDLYGSTDGGANWNQVTSVNKDATGSDGNRYIRRISLTDSDGVITGLAGVNALKFHIMDPGPGGATNNNSIYTEIAAYAAAVPVLADAANSTVVAAPTTVASDGTTTSTITVILSDASNNPVAGKTVTLTSSRAEGVDTISAASGPSSSVGVVTFSVKSSTSGPAIFTATDVSDSNLVISPSTATVTFEAGALSAANSTVAADPSTVTANGSGTSTITVTLKDASGTAVHGKTVSLVSSRGTPPDTISPTTGVSNTSGVVTFAVSSAIAGDATFTATGDSIAIPQTASVTFTPGPVAGGTSTVTASPATATADGIATSTVTVTLMDADSNRVAGKDVSLVSDRGTPPDTILPASGNTSDANGVATFIVSSATVGAPVFTATGDSVPIPETATVSFVYALPLTDTIVHMATGENDSQVIEKWTTDQGSAPVDMVNDLLKNHATVAMAAGNIAAGLGCSLANINDGLQVSKLTDNNTDGICLFTNNGGWPSSGPADLVFTLDANYNIARIDSFTLWDPSRTGQKYDLYGSTDGGASWTFVTSVNKNSGAEASNRDLRRISLANSGGVIPGLAGVNALKFHIMDPGPNGATSNNSIYSEIAAYQVAHGGGSTYADWATANRFDPIHPEAVGNDGLTNLLVYALDLKTDGTNGSPAILTGRTLSFTKRADAVTNNDVTYAIETSPDLQNPWTPVTPDVNDGSAISYTLPTDAVGGKLFARLVVTQK